MTPGGTVSILHEFTGADGRLPRTVLHAGSGRDALCMASRPSGGANDQGAAFQITLAGSYAVLRDFETATGYAPEVPL